MRCGGCRVEGGPDHRAGSRGGDVASSVAWELADIEESGADIWGDEPREVELRGLHGRHTLVSVRYERQARAPERLVVAEDSAIVRDGLASLLREHGMEVVATASRTRKACSRRWPSSGRTWR